MFTDVLIVPEVASASLSAAAVLIKLMSFD